MANFIFPPVITLEQKYARRNNLRAYLENAIGHLVYCPAPKKEVAFDASLSELRNEHPSA